MATRIGRYFAIEEFERASVRRLTLAQQMRAAELVRRVLDAAREAHGPIYVTSYVRDSGAHADGWAVDIQLVSGTDADMLALADWIARHVRPGRDSYVKQVIYEAPEGRQLRAHVHIATRLVVGASAGYIADYAGNRRYAYRDPDPAPPAAPAIPSPAPSIATPEGVGARGVIVAGLIVAAMWAAS